MSGWSVAHDVQNLAVANLAAVPNDKGHVRQRDGPSRVIPEVNRDREIGHAWGKSRLVLAGNDRPQHDGLITLQGPLELQ
jgi:hypothetical protein